MTAPNQRNSSGNEWPLVQQMVSTSTQPICHKTYRQHADTELHFAPSSVCTNGAPMRSLMMKAWWGSTTRPPHTMRQSQQMWVHCVHGTFHAPANWLDLNTASRWKPAPSQGVSKGSTWGSAHRAVTHALFMHGRACQKTNGSLMPGNHVGHCWPLLATTG